MQLITLLLLVGCTGEPSLIATELVLVAQAPDTDNAVYFTGELREDALDLDVWARANVDVFGVSAHVQHSSELIRVEGDTPLGDDALARHLVVESDGDIGLGGTRLSPSLGEVSMLEPIHLATLYFAGPEVPTDFEIDAVSVRRADGSFVDTSAFGAAIVEQEVE